MDHINTLAQFDASPFIRGCYQLPGNRDADIYMIPCSGGADSTALAIMLHSMFPDVPFKMVFTDTLADEVEIYETLDRLEAFLGRKIDRVIPEKGLYELIEQYNGFLPSSQDRYCTRTLKLKPYEQWLAAQKPIFGGQVWSFVGIRADEPWRSGLLSGDDDVHTELPYKAWGIVREDVFKILDQTVGIPRYYARRTRSGCFSCWGMRTAETVGLLEAHPVEFHRAASYEKLSARDAAKHREFIAVADELGIGHNWVGFPLPRELDIRNKDTQRAVFGQWQFLDLARQPSSNVIPFPKRWEGEAKTDWKTATAATPVDTTPQGSFDFDPQQRLWVGVEFRIDPGIGGTGVFWQQIVSFSTSRSGLSRQLQGHYEHRLATAEAVGLTPDEVRDLVKYAVYCIEAPASVMDTDAPSQGSYTWKNGKSMQQIKRLTQFAKRTLNAEQIAQDARIAVARGKMERAEALQAERAALAGPLGKVLGMAAYVAREPEPHAEEDERYTACFACSL